MQLKQMDTKAGDIVKSSMELPELMRMSFLAGKDILMMNDVQNKLTTAVEGAGIEQMVAAVKQLLLYACNYGHQIKTVSRESHRFQLSYLIFCLWILQSTI